ncbi:MAG: DNA polymerase/3'-5' exonuclease PolX, partial [Opitutales bacterium]
MDRKNIIRILGEIAVLLEIKGENPFKIRAYQNGARALETMEDFEARMETGSLSEVPGLGKALCEKITVLHQTGELDYYEKVRASVAPGLLEMLEIPGLGGKKIKALHDALEVKSIEDLQKACDEGRVAELRGFGAKSQENILEGIKNRERYNARHLWWTARTVALPILEDLRAMPEVELAEIAGSFRRRMETVGDLDFIAASAKPSPIMDLFVSMEGVSEVTAKGDTKSSVRLSNGMQADLRVVPREQFYFTLHHFTGSKEHNVQMRQRALSQGLSLSEWGLSVVEDSKPTANPLTTITGEEELFAALGLAFVEPELREGRGEIEAAEEEKLPELFDLTDLMGIFHCHTTASDGSDGLDGLLTATDALGWEYIGISDHSKASFQANGLDEIRLQRQIVEIEKINASGKFKAHAFSGIECDVLSDGSLDLEESILESLDFVIISVHSSFSQSEDEMTARIIKALEHPCVTMLGHLSGRLLLRREPYAVNIEKVIDAAAANGKIIEINANPMRLDMDWRCWRKASQKGVLASINPDAHDTSHYDFCEAGANVAR